MQPPRELLQFTQQGIAQGRATKDMLWPGAASLLRGLL